MKGSEVQSLNGLIKKLTQAVTLTFGDHDVSEYEMEDEEVLKLYRRNSGVRPEVSSKNFPYLNKSEEMVLQLEEHTPPETEQSNAEFQNDSNEIAHLGPVNLNSPEGIRSSSNEDTDVSSTNSDLDSSLSRYYFDGSLTETHEDESPHLYLKMRTRFATQP